MTIEPVEAMHFGEDIPPHPLRRPPPHPQVYTQPTPTSEIDKYTEVEPC